MKGSGMSHPLMQDQIRRKKLKKKRRLEQEERLEQLKKTDTKAWRRLHCKIMGKGNHKRAIERRKQRLELLKAKELELVTAQNNRSYYNEGKEKGSRAKYKYVGNDGVLNNPKFRIPTRFQPGFMRKMDHRSKQFIRIQMNFDLIANQLGGEKELSRLQLVLIEHTVFLMEVLERFETDMIDSPKETKVLMHHLVQAVNLLQSLCKTLGLKKHSAPKRLSVFLKKA